MKLQYCEFSESKMIDVNVFGNIESMEQISAYVIPAL